MYKTKELEKYWDESNKVVPEDISKFVSNIKILSDNYITDNETALRLDTLVYEKIRHNNPELFFKESEITPDSTHAAVRKEDVSQSQEIIEDTQEHSYSMYGDDFFDKNPEKVLGEAYETSGRFGSVTKYKGDITNVSKIDANIPLRNTVETTMSVIETPAEEIVYKEPETAKPIIKKLIEKSKENVVKKQISKRKEKSEFYDVPVGESDTLSFEEVFKMLNADISIEEVQAYVLYKELQGQKLSKKWYDVIGVDYFSDDWADAAEFVKRGLLFYHRAELLPAFIYFAENVYERKTALESSKDDIIELYGQQAYDNQKEKLDAVVNQKLSERKTLDDPEVEKRLIIKPLSEFSRSYKVKTLIDEKEIKVYTKTKKGEKVIDFKGETSQRYYNRLVIEEMTLIDAFKYWLKEYKGQILFKQGTNWLEIITAYLEKRPKPAEMDKTQWSRITSRARAEGDRLFGEFLANWITHEDKRAIEVIWNDKYNGYVKVDYYKVPVAFTCAKKWGNSPMEIKPEKREAVAFTMLNRSGVIAYDVGVGKTPSAIFSISSFLDAGYCKRPLLVVPNQVYRQFKSEIKMLAPHLKVNDLYNMGETYLQELRGVGGVIEKVDENSISIMTYEGFEKIGFSETTQSRIIKSLYDILNQGEYEEDGDDKRSKKKIESFFARLETILGKGMSGTMVNIEDLGFDFMCVDEAHAMKKVFTRVKGKKALDGKGRSKSQYAIQSGTASTIAIKGFCISRYIAENNFDGNIVFLTATPFTNSPLEVFSMLALVGYKKLENTDLNNINNFFDTYVQVNEKLVVNSRLQPERKQVFDGWNNLGSLQQLIYRFIDYKDVNTKDTRGNRIILKRPAKWVFPLKNRVEGTEIIPIEKDKQVETNIQLSPLQQELMANVTSYAEGTISFDSLKAMANVSEVEEEGSDIESEDTTEGEILDEFSFDDKEKKGVRILRAVNFSRSIALNPYLFEFSGLGRPKDYKEYIEASPKMLYTMQCIKGVKEYHENKGTPVSGQIIYMDRGKDYFNLIAEYLVKEIGYKPHEIGIIKSGMTGGKTAKEDIKNKFLGLSYNEETQKYSDIPDDQRIKIVIGSSSIKEGMNLQRHTSVLYDLFLDWNPTDMIQLEGRCWRQGNLFSNVRIVVPLMEDSMDIFMFQKLSEKTKRINAIYQSDIQDTNVLPVDEFDPEELKYSLITDPNVLAKMKIDDIVESLYDRKYSLQYELTNAQNNKELLVTSNNQKLLERVTKVVNMFRGEKERSIDAVIATYTDLIKTQKDENGEPVVVRDTNYDLNIREAHSWGGGSGRIDKIYGFDEWRSANITLKKKLKEWFAPKEIAPTESDIDRYVNTIKSEMLDIDDKIEHVKSEENMREIAIEFIERKRELKAESRGYSERAIEFASYNYLLDDKEEEKQIKEKSIEDIIYSCPPVDENGNNRIDKEAIEMIEKCNSELISTKQLNTLPDGETYTDERIELHNQIISEAMKSAICIEQDKPIAILTGGAPGSGKTTFLKKYAPYMTSDKIFHLDQDELREKLPEYRGWNSAQTHIETRDIAKRILENISNGKPCSFDILYDGTMNTGKNYIPLIESLRKLGYAIYIIYMKIPYETSVKRALGRYQRGGSKGRYVPMTVINEYFENEGVTFEKIKPLVDGWILVDGETHSVLENGGSAIPTDRQYLEGKPADLSEVLEGKVDSMGATKKTTEVLTKVKVLEKKIKTFKVLSGLTKDKTKMDVIAKKINTFNILLKLAKNSPVQM